MPPLYRAFNEQDLEPYQIQRSFDGQHDICQFATITQSLQPEREPAAFESFFITHHQTVSEWIEKGSVPHPPEPLGHSVAGAIDQVESTPRLRFLISPHWDFSRWSFNHSKLRLRPGPIAIPMAAETFAVIEAAFDLPRAFFYPSPVVEKLTEFDAFEGGFGLFIALGYHQLAITYDPQTQIANAIAVTGSDRTGHVMAHALWMRRLVDELSQQRDATPLPLVALVSWLSIQGRLLGDNYIKMMHSLGSMDAELDDHQPDPHQTTYRHDRKPLRSLRFDNVTSFVAGNHRRLKSDENLLDVCLDAVSRVLDGDNNFNNHCLRQQTQCVSQPLQMRIFQLRDSLKSLRTAHRAAEQVASSHTQTVLSLISQRDNEINNVNSEHSKQIAKAMRQLAEDTQELARRTYLDSANMKIIALINLLTLPGTFTATFFSTGFFNFKPLSTDSLVSAWLWLYFVVTVGLLAALGLLWRGWLGRADKRVENLFRKPDLSEATEEAMPCGKAAEDHEQSTRPSLSSISLNVIEDATTDHDAVYKEAPQSCSDATYFSRGKGVVRQHGP